VLATVRLYVSIYKFVIFIISTFLGPLKESSLTLRRSEQHLPCVYAVCFGRQKQPLLVRSPPPVLLAVVVAVRSCQIQVEELQNSGNMDEHQESVY